jgi:hypothetical protein
MLNANFSKEKKIENASVMTIDAMADHLISVRKMRMEEVPVFRMHKI